MATKNLARTAVEAGRSGWQKEEKKQAKRAARRWKPDEEGELLPDPKTLVGRQIGGDKLSPIHAWLMSNIGRSWNKVYSDFCKRFPGDGVLADHIKGHLWDMVDTGRFPPNSFASGWAEFYVGGGILQHRPRKTHWYPSRPPEGQLEEATAWAKGKQVIKRGKFLYWTEDSFPLTDRYLEGSKQQIPVFFSAQGAPMTPKQAEYFNSLHKDVQQALIYDPVRVRQLLKDLRRPS